MVSTTHKSGVWGWLSIGFTEDATVGNHWNLSNFASENMIVS
jgi:hypothetical protein